MLFFKLLCFVLPLTIASSSLVAIAQPLPAAQPDQLLKQGIQQYQTGKVEAALQSWEQALELYRQLKQRDGAAAVLGNLGVIYQEFGDYDRAIAYHQESLAIARELNNRRGEMQTLGNLGNLYQAIHEYRKAIEYHQQVLTIAKSLQDQDGEIKALAGLGNDYHALDDFSQALKYHQQSLAQAQAFKNDDGISNAFGNLGIVAVSMGKYATAIEQYQNSLTIKIKQQDQLGQGQILANLGNLYQILGNPNKAISYLQKSLTIAQALKSKPEQSQLLNELGNSHKALGQIDKAIEYYQESLKIAQLISDRRTIASALGNLGSTAATLKKYDQAIQYYQESLAIKQEIQDGGGISNTLNNLATVYAEMQDYQQAIVYQQQSLTLAQERQDAIGETKSLSNLGLIFMRAQRLPEAETALKSAMTIGESLRTGLADADKISFTETISENYRILQDVLIRQGQHETALEISERGRARAFVELLATRLRGKSPAEINAIAPAPNLEAIKQIARMQNTTLVEYAVIHKNLIGIWVIKPNGEIKFRQVVLDPKTSINKLVLNGRTAINVRGKVSSSQPNDFDSSIENNGLKALHQILIAPIAADLPQDPTQPVVFLPQAALFLVPFAALQDPQGKYLIEKHTIATAPSIQTLALTQQQRKPPRQAIPLIVGNPTMPIFGGGQLNALPGSEAEAKSIAAMWQTQPLIGNQATKAGVLKQMKTATIVHLATHGLIDRIDGDIPGAIALAPSPTDSGLLTAHEIFDLKLNADLVVLSACDTGRGEITGDGVIGLSRSLIAAGTPSVIVSLWAVPDQTTGVLMTEFYRQIRSQKLSKVQALRQAMLKTMRQHPNPIDWAAFNLVGEGQ